MATRIEVIIPSTQARIHPQVEAALHAQTIAPLAIHLIHDADRRGSSWARNQGVERCSAPFIACLDDDCVPPPTWLADILSAFEDHQADIVGGVYEESDLFLAERRQRVKYPGSTGIDHGGFVGPGGNIAFRRQILLDLKADRGVVYNPVFRISQDWELVWALRARGARAVFLSTRVIHLKTLGSWAYLKQQWGRGIGIRRLQLVQRQQAGLVPAHQSRLWSDGQSSRSQRILRLLWHKGIGPFDRDSFSSWRHFLRMWLGEKVQGAGYLYALLSEHDRTRPPR